MATYAIINQETCIGCGNCEGLAPTIFDLDENGFAFVKLGESRMCPCAGGSSGSLGRSQGRMPHGFNQGD
jgi:4Fe-4S single cluster domain of Ferredoxin I